MFGKMLFILLWPAMWFVFPLTRRVRVIVVEKKKLLVVKHFIGLGVWDLPGGGIKFGESVEQAARREIEEELGLEVAAIQELHDDPIMKKQYGLLARVHYVVADLSEKEQHIEPNWEISETAWQDVRKAAMLLPEEIHQIVFGKK